MFNFYDRTGRKLKGSEVRQKMINRLKNIMIDFELMLLRWTGNVPVHFFRRFVYRLAGVKIGKNSTIHMWCNFFYPPNIEVGEGTVIGDHAFLDGRCSLKIGSHTAIASGVMIYNSHHDTGSENFNAVEKEVIIDDYVFIGPRAIILPGVNIGKGAVIGAGAVVTKDVPPFTVAVGVPAQHTGKRQVPSDLHYRLGRTRLFQ